MNTESYQNGHYDGHNKKDKKRTAMVSRLYKLEETFSIDRDYHYRTSLQKLQQGLTSAHAGNNPDVQQKMVDLEEERDYELVRLRLWEEYQVKRAEHELAEDMEKANKEHDEMVKVVKERLYASLEKQVKQLKEDKVLLDLANSHSYNMDTTVDFHKNTRSQQSLKESSISAVGYASDRRPQRRRHDYTSAAEDTNASANESGNNSSRKKTRYSSADESWLSDGDLSSLLFGERREKPATRHSNKSYQPPNSLKTEEIIEDLILLRSLKEQ